MKTAFLAAVAVTVCAEWWMAEEKAPVKSDKLIRRKLRVHEPSDPEQVAKTRLKCDCKKTHARRQTPCRLSGRKRGRSFRSHYSHWCLDWRSGAHPGTLRCSHRLRAGS